jgi:large subunit ribosomal protein L2
MPVKHYKPTSAGRRISSVDAFADVTKTVPEKALLRIAKKHAGRANHGRITVRHQGGGAPQFLRLVDFKREKFDVPAKITAIEYDPNRGARLMLLVYKDGEKRYSIAPEHARVGGQVVASKERGEILEGNRFPLAVIPVGVPVHDIELSPGQGGRLVRSAGTSAQVVAVEGNLATVRLQSGEVRLLSKDCMATVGAVSNPDYRLIRWGKAGRMRHRGIRPTVRGKAMNPVDHPHGGGEGRNSIGLKHPKTPTGKPALGVPTRKKKASDVFILARRKALKR